MLGLLAGEGYDAQKSKLGGDEINQRSRKIEWLNLLEASIKSWDAQFEPQATPFTSAGGHHLLRTYPLTSLLIRVSWS